MQIYFLFGYKQMKNGISKNKLTLIKKYFVIEIAGGKLGEPSKLDLLQKVH